MGKNKTKMTFHTTKLKLRYLFTSMTYLLTWRTGLKGDKVLYLVQKAASCFFISIYKSLKLHEYFKFLYLYNTLMFYFLFLLFWLHSEFQFSKFPGSTLKVFAVGGWVSGVESELSDRL